MRQRRLPVYSVLMGMHGVSCGVTDTCAGSNARMAQPHKGDRQLVGTRLTKQVHDEIKYRASEAGTSISQYVADIVAAHVGQLDEIRELPADALIPRRLLEEDALADIA